MSKLFEALQKTESSSAEMVRKIVEEAFPPQDPVGAEQETPLTVPIESQPPSASETAADSPAQLQVLRAAANAPVLSFDGSNTAVSEQYKIIRSKLRHHDEKPRMILVSSAMPGDGKTISAANLASALSLQANLRVLLVDSDFRHSSLSRLLGFSVTPGLSDILRGEATLESALISVEQFPNLYFLPSGSTILNPSDLLSTAKWQSMIETFRHEFRFSVFDGPPVGMVADYEQLQHACDGVVLIARPDHTNRRLWRKALEIIPKSKQLGVILNCVENWFLWKTPSYYHYYSDPASLK